MILEFKPKETNEFKISELTAPLEEKPKASTYCVALLKTMVIAQVEMNGLFHVIFGGRRQGELDVWNIFSVCMSGTSADLKCAFVQVEEIVFLVVSP